MGRWATSVVPCKCSGDHADVETLRRIERIGHVGERRNVGGDELRRRQAADRPAFACEVGLIAVSGLNRQLTKDRCRQPSARPPHRSQGEEPLEPQQHAKEASFSMGATQTLTRQVAGYWLTLVGEVPMSTLKLFADNLEHRK